MSFVVVQTQLKNTTGSSTTITLPGAPTAGNLMIVEVGNAGTTSSVTQTGVTYTRLANVPVNTWWGIATAGASASATVSITSSAGVAIVITEYSTAGAISYTNNQQSNSSGNGTTLSSGGVSAGGIDYLIVGALANSSGAARAQTQTSAFTEITNQVTANDVRMVTYRLLTAVPGTYGVSATVSGAVLWFADVASFFALYPVPGGVTEFFPEDGNTTVDPSAVTLTWGAGQSHRPGEVNLIYNVYFGTDPDAMDLVTTIYDSDGTAHEYDVGQLDVRTTYYWRIDTLNTDGITMGDVLSFTTKNIYQYDVFIAQSPLGPWTKVTTTPIPNNAVGNSYDVTGLTNGVKYYIMVLAGILDDDNNFVYRASQALQAGSNPGVEVISPNVIGVMPVNFTTNQFAALGCQVNISDITKGI